MRETPGAITAAVLLGLLGVLAWRSIVDVDFGIHVAGGRWIAENGRVPELDPFTYTVSDHAYVAYHWLFQLVVYGLERAAGVTGPAALRWLLLMGTGLAIADLLRLRRVSPLSASCVGLAAVLASEWRFTLRPELTSLFLSAATLWVLERRRQGVRSPLWLLPAIQLLWVNLHVYALGWGILAVYLTDECARARRLCTPLFAWSAVSALALLANPYGLEAVAYPLLLATRLGADNVFATHITELVSPLVIARDPRTPFSMGVQLEAYRLLLLLGVLSLPLHLWRRRFVDAALIAIYAALSALAVRNLAIYAVVATLPLCTALDDLIGEGRATGRARAALAAALHAGVLAVAALTALRVATGVYYAEDWRHDRFAAELCRHCLAADAADWLAARDLAGPGFNDLIIGGTLLWRDPRHPVFIDGRNEVTGEAFYREYLEALDPLRFDDARRRWGFEYVVLRHGAGSRSLPLAEALYADPAWRLVYVDGAAVVYVRVEGPNGGLREAALPPPISGRERDRRLTRLRVPEGLSARAWRWLASRERPPGDSYGLGSFLLSLGLPRHAEAPLLSAAAESPGFYEPHFDLGVLYQRLERWGAARHAFRNALALEPDLPELAPLSEALSEALNEPLKRSANP